MRIEHSLLLPESVEWRDFLRVNRHDFYHLPRYAVVEAMRQGGEAAAVHVTGANGEALLMPVVLCALPDAISDGQALLDAVSPYGYPAPLFNDQALADTSFQSLAGRAVIDCLWGARVVSAFIRLHPLIPAPPPFLSDCGTVQEHGRTVWVDTSGTYEALRSGMRKTNRNLINRMIRDGYTCRFDEDFEHYGSFIHLYHDTMRRVGAASWYLFTEEYFRQLRHALEGRLRLCIVEKDGRIAAAGLFTLQSPIVQYHLSASSEEYLKDSPTRLMLDHVCRWAVETDAVQFHLGGGLGSRQDGLFDFKAAFSPNRAQFCSLRIVAMKREYEQACANHAAALGLRDEFNTDFFPAYRCPPPETK